MTNFQAAIQQFPTISGILARRDFDAQGVCQLPIFEMLDRATWWCELMWRNHGKGYRRYVDAQAQTATFDFSDYDMARHFNDLFGVR